MRGFTPQARVRYRSSTIDSALRPADVAITQVNDTNTQVVWTTGNTVRAMTDLGIRIYFLRDNIAFGVEGKFYIMGRGSFTALGEQGSLDLNTGTMTFGFRLFYPELHPEASSAPHKWARFYGGIRIGGVFTVEEQVFVGIDSVPGQSFFGTRIGKALGAGAGVDLGRYYGVGHVRDYGPQFNVPGVGSIGKFALYPILLQGRLRYPLLGGAVEPYLIGGLGVELAEPDKPNQNAMDLGTSGRDTGFAASLGAGAQYFLTRDIALAAEFKYIFSRDIQYRIDSEPTQNGDADALFFTLGLRAYLFDL